MKKTLIIVMFGFLTRLIGAQTPADGDIKKILEDRIDAQIFGEYRPSNSIGINTTLSYSQAISDDTPYNENLEFTRYQVFLGARWFM